MTTVDSHGQGRDRRRKHHRASQPPRRLRTTPTRRSAALAVVGHISGKRQEHHRHRVDAQQGDH
ncbi:hypothetical protein ACFPN7_07225 [Amycolatopsis halotolerans]|uniref:hypothetical protein n=1 Tax=Amycolatopsis halotolerans TaxID=330083 RepID=UPI0036066B9A